MTGTDLEIIAPGAHGILGAEVDRTPTLRTTASSDEEMLAVWLKNHQDGSPHTFRVYTRVGRRFIEALAARNTDLRHATVEDVQEALQTMRTKADGTPVRPATVNTYVATVKSFLNFAHTIGYTRFNAAPLIKLKKAPRHLAKRILSEVDIHVLLRAARPGRDRLLLTVAYFGGLRVSELVALTWANVIGRDSGEVQLDIIGKGSKDRQLLLPPEISAELLESRQDAPADAPVFPSPRGGALTDRAVNYMIKRTAARAGIQPDPSVHWLRHAHASHALDNGAPISLVQATLGHESLATTSVYTHARPGESSGRYLKVG